MDDKHWGDEDGLIIVDVNVGSFFLLLLLDYCIRLAPIFTSLVFQSQCVRVFAVRLCDLFWQEHVRKESFGRAQVNSEVGFQQRYVVVNNLKVVDLGAATI